MPFLRRLRLRKSMANHTDDRKPDNGGLNIVAGIMIAVANSGSKKNIEIDHK